MSPSILINFTFTYTDKKTALLQLDVNLFADYDEIERRILYYTKSASSLLSIPIAEALITYKGGKRYVVYGIIT